MTTTYSIQQAEKCGEEAARASDDDIRAYWKEAERCWLALAQGTFSSGQSDHVTVVVQDDDIVVSITGFLCRVLQT